jgi:hypothetical protein
MPKPKDSFHYAEMSHTELLTHVTAYAEAIHELASRCMAAEGRLKMIEKTRSFFNQLPIEARP